MSSQFSYNRLTISLTIEKNWKTGMSCDLHLVSAEKNECIFKTKIKSWRIRKLENIHTHAYMYVYVHIQRERDLKPFAVLLKWAQNCKRLNSSFFKKLEILPLLSFPQRAITCFPLLVSGADRWHVLWTNERKGELCPLLQRKASDVLFENAHSHLNQCQGLSQQEISHKCSSKSCSNRCSW